MSENECSEFEEADDSHKDRDYIPGQTDSSSSIEFEVVTQNRSVQRTKKRVRKEEEWKRTKAKRLRNCGKEYNGKKGEHHNARLVKGYLHNCRYKCNENISDADRQEIFDKYWGLGSWDLQTAFISSCIEKSSTKRPNENAQYKKSASSSITLKGHRVCKTFFLRTLDISNKRYSNVLKKKSSDGIAETDKRGKQSPSNKLQQSEISFVKRHINSFPKFKSHYSRKNNPHKQYLDSSLSVNKMYELYVERCKSENRVPVKIHSYRNIFNKSFNLSFHKPYSDTCTTCDSLNNTINHSTSIKEKEETSQKKELHLRKAEAARSAKKIAKDRAIESSQRVAFSFDLQKTLPTPYLTCSKVYYLRQLWTYNFGVHNLASGTGTMYMWSENEASRGSQEIISCLYRFISELSPDIKHIDAFSDNAGGQNKNKNIVKFWSFIVNNTPIESIDHRFFISGHSFMECDQDFAIIERAKKKSANIFVPDDWCTVVTKASRKFKVVRMYQNDFKSIQPMSDVMKDNIPGIRNMQWLHFEKSTPFSLFFKETLNEDMEFRRLDLKKNAGRPPLVELPPLYGAPLKIKFPKYKNLLDLLPFIPPIHHEFYKSLPYEVRGNKNQRDQRASTTVRTAERVEISSEEESDHILESDCNE